MVVTWEDLHKPEDLDLLKGEKEKEIISEMERDCKEKCPYLCKVGTFSYFCGAIRDEKGNLEIVSDEVLGLLLKEEMRSSNHIYRALQRLNELSLYCFGSWENCGYVTSSHEPPLHYGSNFRR